MCNILTFYTTFLLLVQHFFSLYNIPTLLYNTPMPCTTLLCLVQHYYSSYHTSTPYNYSICPLFNTFLLLAKHPYPSYFFFCPSTVQYSYFLYKSPTLFSVENSYLLYILSPLLKNISTLFINYYIAIICPTFIICLQHINSLCSIFTFCTTILCTKSLLCTTSIQLLWTMSFKWFPVSRITTLLACKILFHWISMNSRLVRAARETSKFQNWSLLPNSHCHYMAEILLIGRKTLSKFWKRTHLSTCIHSIAAHHVNTC